VAKYETPNGSPATNDVVLAFALFLRHGESHFGSAATFDLQGAWSLLGLNTGKTYRVRNLASSDASAYLTSGWPQTGQQLWDNGIFVHLGGGTNLAITADGQLVQYLKLEEFTATNAAPVITLPGPHVLALGSSTSFPVTVSDANGNPVTTNLVSGPAGSTFSGGSSVGPPPPPTSSTQPTLSCSPRTTDRAPPTAWSPTSPPSPCPSTSTATAWATTGKSATTPP
jgi:hypothetical protein